MEKKKTFTDEELAFMNEFLTAAEIPEEIQQMMLDDAVMVHALLGIHESRIADPEGEAGEFIIKDLWARYEKTATDAATTAIRTETEKGKDIIRSWPNAKIIFFADVLLLMGIFTKEFKDATKK